MPSDFSYDKVPYISTFQPQIFPDRFALNATLLGMKPAAPASCRYLELGCGEGDNLISFAFYLPESQFVGVDLSQKHIETANRSVAELGLTNIKFLQKDVMEMSREEFGEFDYIAAHGLYSWVPEFVREKILSLFSELLGENGVGYLSYNTLPGGYLRQMSREMMLFHTADAENDLGKVEKGVEFLKFLQQSTRNDPYFQEILKNEIGFVTNHDPVSAFHDEFGEINHAFYLHEFVSDVEKHGLKYLSEAEYISMPMNEFPRETAELLSSFGGDIVRCEQYIDFLRCRRFRQTLVCKGEAKLDRNIALSILSELYAASPFNPVDENAELHKEGREKFRFPSGATAEMEHVLTKVALSILGKAWTEPIKFSELMDRSTKYLEDKGVTLEDREKERRICSAIMLELFTNKLVELHVHKPDFTREIGEFPKTSRLARWQLEKSDSVTTANITQVKIDDSFFRNLIFMLDGTRTKLDLKKELRAKISKGELSDVGEKGDLLRDLTTMLNENLKQIADLGLLIS